MKTIFLVGKCEEDLRREAIAHVASSVQGGWSVDASDIHQIHGLSYASIHAMAGIKKCEFLIAVLNSPDCFGSVAEIAYALALGKECFLWIGNDEFLESLSCECGENEICEICTGCLKPPCVDAYGFIANMVEEHSIRFEYSCHGQWIVNDLYECVEDFETDRICLSSDVSTCIPFIEKILARKNCLKSQSPNSTKCQSPIEKSFLSAAWNAGLRPVPQFPAGRFFLDFAFPDSRVCVELDGHDYHKTKEQRTSDAQRQRWLEMNNWRVIRFTGTEVHKNVASCVVQTLAFLRKVRAENGIDSIAGG